MGDTLPHGAPEFRQISLDMLRLACRRAASDMRREPLFRLFFAGFMSCWDGYWCAFHLKQFKAIGWFWLWADFLSSPPLPPWDYTRHRAGWRRMNPCHGATFWA